MLRIISHLSMKVSTADSSTECIERGKVPILITTSPVRVSPDLKISGHLLTVAVFSRKHQVSGVSVALYSEIAVKASYENFLTLL